MLNIRYCDVCTAEKRWLSLKYEISAVSLHFLFCFVFKHHQSALVFLSNELHFHSHKNYTLLYPVLLSHCEFFVVAFCGYEINRERAIERGTERVVHNVYVLASQYVCLVLEFEIHFCE